MTLKWPLGAGYLKPALSYPPTFLLKELPHKTRLAAPQDTVSWLLLALTGIWGGGGGSGSNWP